MMNIHASMRPYANNYEMADNFVNGVSVGAEKFGDMHHCYTPWGEPADGFVYFISTGVPQPNYVKIGFTKGDPFKRMSGLQTGNPIPLTMIGYFFGSLGIERKLHETLDQFRTQGEWFRFSEVTAHWIEGFLNEAYP